jgi:hypothetical protein
LKPTAPHPYPANRYTAKPDDHSPISNEVLLIMTERNERHRSKLLKRSSPASRVELRNILRQALVFARGMLSELDHLPDTMRTNRRKPLSS